MNFFQHDGNVFRGERVRIPSVSFFNRGGIDKLGMILMWSSKYKKQKGFHQFHNRKKLVCLKNFGEVSTFTKVSSLLFFVITSSQKTSQRNFNRLRAIKLAQLNQITKKTFPRLKNRCKTREDENKANSLYSDSIRSNVA